MRRQPVQIDLTRVKSEREMHTALASALDFPAWYGENADALWDAITGLVDMPYGLRFVGWNGFAARLPKSAAQLTSAFDKMSAEYPTLAPQVVYE